MNSNVPFKIWESQMSLFRLLLLGLLLSFQASAHESPLNLLVPKSGKEIGPFVSIVLWDDNAITRQLYQVAVENLLTDWQRGGSDSSSRPNLDADTHCWVLIAGQGPYFAQLECTKTASLSMPRS